MEKEDVIDREKMNNTIENMNKFVMLKLLIIEHNNMLWYAERISRSSFLTRWYWRTQLYDSMQIVQKISDSIKEVYDN